MKRQSSCKIQYMSMLFSTTKFDVEFQCRYIYASSRFFIKIRHWNSLPLSDLTVLMHAWNLVLIKIVKSCNNFLVSVMAFASNNHVCLVWSSTIVSKYLCPCKEGWKVAHSYECGLNEKVVYAKCMLDRKCNFYCFVEW